GFALAFAEQAARTALARKRSVHASERFDADEVAEDEHVQRDLKAQLLLDLDRRVRVLARLVVLNDPARAERVDVDPVDLPGQRDAVSERQPALQLRRSALATERDLEPPWDELRAARALLSHDGFEVAPKRLVQLARLHLGHLHAHAAEGFVETRAHEAHRT